MEDTIKQIVLKNKEHGRVEFWIKGGEQRTLAKYIALVVQNYMRNHPYLTKLQVERDDGVWKELAPKLHKWAYNYLIGRNFYPGSQTRDLAMEYVSEASMEILTARFPYDVEFDPWVCKLLFRVCSKQIRKSTKKILFQMINS